MTEIAPFGDLGAGPINDNHRRAMLLMASRDSRAQVWLDNVTPNRCQQRVNAWLEFLFYPSTPAPVLTTTTWPTYYTASGTSVASARNNWSPTATQVLFNCGPTRESHEDRAKGEVLIYKNTWLGASAKLTSRSGIMPLVEDHNCISVDMTAPDPNTPQTWTQDQSKIVAEEHVAGLYDYYNADLTGAYVNQFTQYNREVFFLQSKYVVIRDTYTLVDSTQKVTWHWHTLTLPAINAPFFKAGALNGKFILPNVSPLSIITSSDIVPSFRIDAKSGIENAFLVAMEAGNDTIAPSTIGKTFNLPSVNGVQCGANVISWLTGNGPWQYSSPSIGNHFLLGLDPLQKYTINNVTLVSSKNGVIDTPVAIPVNSQVVIIKVGTVIVDPIIVPPTPKDRTFTVVVPATGVPTIKEVI
jgi:hypothetical protein